MVNNVLEIIISMLGYNLIAYLGLFIHESGHLVTAKYLGADAQMHIKRRTFQVRFTFHRGITLKEDVLITLAGPIFQLMLVLMVIFQPLSPMLMLFGVAQLPSAFINLIPYEGSDGYFISKNLSKNYEIKYYRLSIILYFISIGIALYIFYKLSFMLSSLFPLYTVLFICVYIWYKSLINVYCLRKR